MYCERTSTLLHSRAVRRLLTNETSRAGRDGKGGCTGTARRAGPRQGNGLGSPGRRMFCRTTAKYLRFIFACRWGQMGGKSRGFISN
jgi:hypothetical protein